MILQYVSKSHYAQSIRKNMYINYALKYYVLYILYNVYYYDLVNTVDNIFSRPWY